MGQERRSAESLSPDRGDADRLHDNVSYTVQLILTDRVDKLNLGRSYDSPFLFRNTMLCTLDIKYC